MEIKDVKKLPDIKKHSKLDIVKYSGKYWILDEIIQKSKYVLKWIQIPDTCKYYPEKKRGSPSFGAQGCSKMIMKGNDGKLYISKADKRGVYTWKKFTMMDEAKSAEDYYFQWGVLEEKFNKKDFMKKFKNAQKELEKHGIYFLCIGWKCCLYFIDDAWYVAEDILMKKAKVENPSLRSLIFLTDYKLFEAIYDSGVVRLQHNILRKDKDIVKNVLKKHFKNVKIGSVYDEIEIKLPRK